MGGIKVPQYLFLKRLKLWKRISFVLFIVTAVESFLLWSKR
jgi:hypothetical protein